MGHFIGIGINAVKERGGCEDSIGQLDLTALNISCRKPPGQLALGAVWRQSLLQTEEQVQRPWGQEQHKVKQLQAEVDGGQGAQSDVAGGVCRRQPPMDRTGRVGFGHLS